LGAKVSIDKTAVKLGDEVHIKVDQVPAGWSGEVRINGLRHFPISSKLYALRVTNDNGFDIFPANQVVVTVKDRATQASDEAQFQIIAQRPMLTLTPDGDAVWEFSHSGQIEVTGPADKPWSVKGVPDWITITQGQSGVGSGTVAYTVQPTNSAEGRSATLEIGDAFFSITQDGATSVRMPYTEQFTTLPSPVWLMDKTGHAPTPWVMEDPDKVMASTKLTSDGPNGSKSLLLNRSAAQREAWKGQMYLTRIQTQPGRNYKVSLALKAENPALAWIAFEQRAAPYSSCGFSEKMWVPEVWHDYTFRFQEKGQKCGAENNRLTIRYGTIAGKLWISKFSLSESK
jgi:hypothetical protein